MIASDFLVLPMRLTEAIIVYGREDKQRNLKIVRSKEFRPNFRAAEQNVGRIWPPQPKCSKVGKVHLHGSQVRCPGAGRCALHYPTPSYTNTTLQARVQQEDFTGASTGSEVAETGE